MSSYYMVALDDMMRGDLDLMTEDIRILLVGASYTFNSGHVNVSDLVAHEVAFTNYERKQLSGRSISTASGDHATFDADDISYGNIGNGANDTVEGLVLFRHNADDALARLIAFASGPSFTTPGSDVWLEINGLLRLWRAPGVVA